MINFKKAYSFKIIAMVVVGTTFFSTTTLYPYPIIKESALRVQSVFQSPNEERILSSLDHFFSPHANANRKEKFDRLFFRTDGAPNGYLNSLIRNYKAVKALTEGREISPISIEIQPSGECNAMCRYCGFIEHRAKHKDMHITEEEIRILIRQIDEYNKKAPIPLTEMKFNGIFSEPLTGEAKRTTVVGIEEAVNIGIQVGLYTNGIELDESVQKALVGTSEKSASFVNISLDTASWEIYHKLKRRSIDAELAEKEYRKNLNNIKDLVELRNKMKSGLQIYVSCVLQNENSSPQEIEKLITLAKELGVDSIRIRYPYKKRIGAPGEEEIRQAYEKIVEMKERYKDDNNFSIAEVYPEEEVYDFMKDLFNGIPQMKFYNTCRVPYLRLTLGPDGNFYPCDHRGYIGGGVIGHIGQGYENVVESRERQEAVKVINPHLDKRCEFCAMYNNYLNGLLQILDEEHEKDKELFDWLEREYGDYIFASSHNIKTQELRDAQKVLQDAIKKGVNIDALNALLGHIDILLTNVSERKMYSELERAKKKFPAEGSVITPQQHVVDLSSMLKGGEIYQTVGNGFKGYNVGEKYNPYDFINSTFRDEGFLRGIELLRRDVTGRSYVNIHGQKDLMNFIRNFIRGRFNTGINRQVETDILEQVISKYSEKISNLLEMLSSLSYLRFEGEAKDAILKLMPSFIMHTIGQSIKDVEKIYPENLFGEDIASERDFYFKTFSDLVIAAVYTKIDSMREGYYSFLPRQFVLTLDEFSEKFMGYKARTGFGDNLQPVIMLTDAEPLVYPFLGLLKDKSSLNPQLLYFNRLTCMTEAETRQYDEQKLPEKSLYSRAKFIAQTKLYGFFRGDPEKGITSVIEESAKEASEIANGWFLEYLTNSSYSKISGTDKRIIFDKGQEVFQSDVEKLFLLLLAKKILILIEKDKEIGHVLEKIYSDLMPESLKTREKKVVFIDTGIKGSLPGMLASLIYINDLPMDSIQSKRDYIDSIIANQDRLRNESIRARVFLYGVEPSLRAVVPNAGFLRFGYGGANSFMDEQVPKFIEFDSLDENGLPRCRIANDFERYQGHVVIEGAKQLIARRQNLKIAYSSEKIEEIIKEKVQKNKKPIYLFVDLDNVVFQPIGYLGSENWFRDMFSMIFPQDDMSRQALGEINRKYDRRLQDRMSYEMLLNVKRIKETFRGREVRIIGMTGRTETQRKTTQDILNSMGLLEFFDHLDFVDAVGPTKRERVEKYLEQNKLIEKAKNSNIFVIDDASHNIYPFLLSDSLNIMPILFKPQEENNKRKCGMWFFELANEYFDRGDHLVAKELYLNALANTYMPLNSNEIKALGLLYGDMDGIVEKFLFAVNESVDELEEGAFDRVENILIELVHSDISKESLSNIAKTVLRINKSYGKFSHTISIFEELVNSETSYINLFRILKQIESIVGKTIIYQHFKEDQRIALEEDIKSKIRSEISNQLHLSPYLQKIIESCLNLIEIKFKEYKPGDTKEFLESEYVYDNHGNVVEQYVKKSITVNARHTDVTVDFAEAIRFLKNRLWIIEDIKSYMGIKRSKPIIPESNIRLIREAWENKKISMNSISDKRLRDFMLFAKKNGLENLLIIGGGIRDIFFGTELADIDTALKIRLTVQEREALRVFFRPFDQRIHGEAMKELSMLAEAFGVNKEDFLRNNGPLFEGLRVTYIGPIETKTLRDKADTYIVRILFDAETREELSFNSGIGLLKLGIDLDGNLYGEVESLKDLLEGNARLHGDGTNFRLGEILRFLRLKYQYGLNIDAISYGIIKWKIDEYLQKRLPLPKIVLSDCKAQVKTILDKAIDRAAAERELGELGIFKIIDMAERGELEIEKIITAYSDREVNYQELVESIRQNPNIKKEAENIDVDYLSLHVTQYCNLNCRHCGGDSIPLPISGRLNRKYILPDSGVNRIVRILNTGYDGEIVIAGGGEPTLEFDKILHIGKFSKCSSILIVTNGAFGLDKLKAKEYIEKLLEIARHREGYPLKIRICISTDNFHQEGAPVQAVKNIIDIIMELEKESPGLFPVEVFLTTLHGFDQPVFELAKAYSTDYKPLKPGEKGVAKLMIDTQRKVDVQYYRFMDKSARSKRVIDEVPEDLISHDRFPIEGISQYKIGGTGNKLDIRIFEDGQVVVGREGRSNLIMANIDDDKVSMQILKEISIADPIIRALRENGLEYLISVATSIYPDLSEEIERCKRERKSFLIERILHVLVEDNVKKIVIAYRIAKDHPRWLSSKEIISAIEEYIGKRDIHVEEFITTVKDDINIELERIYKTTGVLDRQL